MCGRKANICPEFEFKPQVPITGNNNNNNNNNNLFLSPFIFTIVRKDELLSQYHTTVFS